MTTLKKSYSSASRQAVLLLPVPVKQIIVILAFQGSTTFRSLSTVAAVLTADCKTKKDIFDGGLMHEATVRRSFLFLLVLAHLSTLPLRLAAPVKAQAGLDSL